MEQRLKILFWLYRSKMNEKGLAPIYLRLTIAGKKTEIATGHFARPEKWDTKKGEVRGKHEEANQINQSLGILKGKALKAFNQLSEQKAEFTAETIKAEIFGKTKERKTLLEVITWHISRVKEQIGIEYALATYKRYNTVQVKVEMFLKYKYQREDILLSEITVNFIVDFEHFLKVHEGISHNSACKYIKMFKRFTNLALTYGWLERNPFAGYRIKSKEKERGYLTQDEIDKIRVKKITIPRIDQVRDIFIFSCYTGLAYSGVKKLSVEHLTNGIDGQKWIITQRTKTDKRSAIPLLPHALEVLEKYKPQADKTGMLLPVLSNQRMNSYLKEVGDICGITKVLTYHLARHSFATTIALTNGVPIETVSKMLGHASLKTTQIYAKVVDTKISNDMQKLKEKLR